MGPHCQTSGDPYTVRWLAKHMRRHKCCRAMQTTIIGRGRLLVSLVQLIRLYLRSLVRMLTIDINKKLITHWQHWQTGHYMMVLQMRVAKQYTDLVYCAKVSFIAVGNITNGLNKAGSQVGSMSGLFLLDVDDLGRSSHLCSIFVHKLW